MSPRGRRPAGADTRGLIVEAARTEFAAQGYAAASLRSIARRAGVDPALVHHYFAGKTELFGEVMTLPVSPSMLIERLRSAPRDQVGVTIARSFFTLWDTPVGRERLRAILASVMTHEDAARPIREFLADEVFTRVASYADGSPLPPGEARLRGGLAAGQLIGVALLRYVAGYEAIVEASVEGLVAALAPTLQAHLVVDLPPGLTPSGDAGSASRAGG
ncbi:MAG: TetR family transcriptional regulator [Dermatophilaceae bacterium]